MNKNKEMERLYSKARHDEAQVRYEERQKGNKQGKDEIIEKMRKSGMSEEEIDSILAL